MLRKSNNVFAALLSDGTLDATSTAILPADGTVITKDNLAAGAVCFVDAGMRREVLADVAAGDSYRIVQGLGSSKPLMISPVIVKGTEKITSQKFVPSVQQVTTVGYNGTTGSLPSANSTAYYVKIRKNDNDAGNRSQPFSLFGQFKTSAAADQEELASGLAANLIKNLSIEPANNYCAVDLLMDEAGTEALGAADTIVATAGSREIVLVESGGVLPHLFVVGDFIRLGTATTDPVYKITKTTVTVAAGGTLTVDRAVTTSFAPTAGTGTTEFIGASTSLAAEFGIRLTGIQADFDVNNWRDYYVNRFTASFSDTATLITSVTGAKTGTGMFQQVAMDEYMNWGQGTIGTPPTIRESAVKIPGTGGNTALTSKYSTINIAWTEDISYLTSSSKAKGNVLVYLNLADSSGVGKLATSPDNPGEVLATALGITASTLDEA